MFAKPSLRATLTLTCRRFVAAEEGTTAIEYAIIASGVGAAIAATVWNFGSELTAVYEKVAAAFS